MRGPWWKLALVALVAALFAGRWLALATVDRLWAESLGVGGAHSDIALLRLALGGGAFLIAATWYVGNLLLVYRQIGAVQVPRQVGDLEIVEHVPRPYLLGGAVVTGLVLGVVSSYGAGGWWSLRALATVSGTLDTVDPVLGRDLGYYLFRLPWELQLHRFALTLAVVALVSLALLYAAIGAVRRDGRRLILLPFARWHLAALSGTVAIVLAWGYALEPGELVAGLHGVPYDTILTDIRIPAALVLTVVALGVATASLVWLRVDRLALPVTAWSVLLVTTFAAHFIVPSAVAAGRGAARRDAPDLDAAAAGLRRRAFQLRPESLAVPLAVPDDRFAARRERDLAQIPVWDAFVLTEVLNRVARPMPPDPRSSGRFYDATLVALADSAGRPLPAFLAAREPDSLGRWPADADRGAAIGAVAVDAIATAPGGMPRYLPRLDRPDSAVATPTDLALASAETWFAPNMSGPAYPAAGEDALGIAVEGLGRRVALAWSLQTVRMLSGSRVPAGTVVAVERAVGQRLARFAPFARFGAAWPAVVDGRLVWTAWGYVSARGAALGTPVVWRGRPVRMLQAGFIGTVDAASGVTRVYLAPEHGPVSEAWRALFPDLVLPAEAMPAELRRQLRYPLELFRAQLSLLRSRPGRARLAEPYWWVGASAGDTGVRLRLRAVDEVQLEPRVASVVEGVLRDGKPRLRVLHYPEPYALPGPSELERVFADAAPEGAAVGGRVRLLVFEDGAVGLQSFYADSGTLAGVVAGWQGAAGSGATPVAALRRVRRRTDADAAAASPFEAARAWFRRLDRARQRGDWAAFGEAWQGLRDALGVDSVREPGAVAGPEGRD